MLLSAVLIALTPGVGAWQAAAQVAPVAVNVPVGGFSAGAAGAGIGASALRGDGTTLPGASLSLSGALAPGLAAPLLAPNPNAPSGAPAAAGLSLPASAVTGSPARYGIKPFGGGARERTYQAPPALSPIRAADAFEAPVLTLPFQAQDPGVILKELPSSEALKNGAQETAANGVPQAGRFRGVSGNIRSRIESLRRHFSALRDTDLRGADDSIGKLSGREGQGLPEAADPLSAGTARAENGPSAAVSGARLLQVSLQAPAGMALRLESRKEEGVPPALALLGEEAVGQELVKPGADVALPPSAISRDEGGRAAGVAAAQPSAPGQEGGEKKPGLGKAAMSFIASLLVAQVGVEALGSSMPTLVQKTFGDFTMVAQLAIFSSLAGILGRQLGPVIVEKFGLKKTYMGSFALRLVSISVLAGLLATGHMSLPLMMAFYSLNGLLQGLSVTAMNSIPPALVGQNPAKLERFWSVEQTLLETIGILGPIATGAVVSAFGFLPALIAFPVSAAASIAIVAMTLRLPQDSPVSAETSAKAAGAGNVFKEFFAKIGRGAKLIWANPALRISFLAYSLFMMINPFLYSMIGPAYALRLVGPENAELATSVAGWLTGLYSAGGLLGGLLMTRESHRIEKARNSGAIDEAQEKEVLRRSLLKWMMLGTGGLAFLASLAFPLPTLASMLVLPSFLRWAGDITVPALALIPFGIAQVVATLKLQSFFQSRVPRKEDMPAAMGFLGSASLALTTAGLLGLKFLFKGLSGFAPFWVISALLVPLAVSYLVLRRKLAKHTDPV